MQQRDVARHEVEDLQNKIKQKEIDYNQMKKSNIETLNDLTNLTRENKDALNNYLLAHL